jgi:hypothetical protein
LVWGLPGRFTHRSAWTRRFTRNAAVLFGNPDAARVDFCELSCWLDPQGPLSPIAPEASKQELWKVCILAFLYSEGKLRNLGLEASPKRSTLSYANGRRPWQLFEALFYSILEVARTWAPGKRPRFKNKLFSLDATIVELCLEMFDWAKYRQTKGAIKLHVLLDHDGYLPVYAHVSVGHVPEIEIARALMCQRAVSW